MTIAKISASILGLYSLSAALLQGQAILTFADIKNFRLTGPESSDYEGGSWDVTLADGTIVLLPCPPQAFPAFIPPIIPCPAGTTGLITQGDLDQDGVSDGGLYFSIAQPLAAVQVEPFQSSLISLAAAPPSDLPRPTTGFTWQDTSLVVFYDLVQDPVNGVGFEISNYFNTRPYGVNELERQRDEITNGTYVFNFPLLGSSVAEPRVFEIAAFHRVMAEAFPGPGGRNAVSGGIITGNDFRIPDEDVWQGDVIQFDPRVTFNFEWEGINTQTFLASDSLFFSIRDVDTDQIVFPPFPDDRAFPQLIGSNNLGIPSGYELGAGFFAPGLDLEVVLQFSRNLVTGNSIDASTRTFRWNVSLVDSFNGFFANAFPFDANEDLIGPSDDFDDDGFTNLQEFGLQTSPSDPADVPVLATELDPFTNQCTLTVPKRPFVGESLDYLVQYSFDMEDFVTIDNDDPFWFIVTDNDEEITVLSRRPFGEAPCFLRVRFRENF